MDFRSRNDSSQELVNCCFCCFQVIHSSTNYPNEFESAEAHDEIGSRYQEFSLRNIYRFLKLLQNEEEEKNFKTTSMRMSVCKECSKLISEFNELYNLWEVTKLRLHWCIQKLQDVMSKAEDDSKLSLLVKIWREKEELMEMWRTNGLNRMKVISPHPRVVVHKMKQPPSLFLKHNYFHVEAEKGSADVLKTDPSIFTPTSPTDETDWIDTEMPDEVETPYSPPSLLPNANDFDDDLEEEDNFNYGKIQYSTPSFFLTEMQVPPHDPDVEVKMECNVEVTEENLESSFQEENQVLERIKVENGISNACQRVMPKRKSRLGTKQPTRSMSNFNSVPGNKDKVCCTFCKKTMNRKKSLTHWNYFCVKGMRRPIISKKRGDTSTKCPCCPFVCAGGIVGMASSMEKHKMRFHPEYYFPEEREKAAGLKLEQFQRILTEVLFSEFILTENNHTSCSLCGKKYIGKVMYDNRIMLHRHLICKHRTELTERLEIILNDPLLEEMSKANETTCEATVDSSEVSCVAPIPKKKKQEAKKTKYTSNCPYCRFKCSATLYSPMRDSVVKHLIRFHPEHFLLKEGEKSSGHWRKQLRKILINNVFPKFVRTSGRQTACSLCEKEYNYDNFSMNTVMAKKHLLFKHKQEVEEEVTNLSKDSKCDELATQEDIPDTSIPSKAHSSKKLLPFSRREKKTKIIRPQQLRIKKKPNLECMSNFTPVSPVNTDRLCCELCQKIVNRKNTSAHWRYFCPKGLRRPVISLKRKEHSSKCSYCPFVCAGGMKGMSSSMVRHQVRFHPEQYFPDERKKMSELKLEKFQRILMDFLFPEFILNVGSFTSCSICEKKYQTTRGIKVVMQRHLVFKHRTELKEKLNVILEDPMLEDGLDSLTEEEKEETKLCSLPKPDKKQPVRVPKRPVQKLKRKQPIPVRKRPVQKLKKQPVRVPTKRATRVKQVLTKYPSDCPYCPYKCGSNGINNVNYSMVAHFVRKHPEHFLNLDNDGWGQKAVRKILTDLVFPKFVLSSGNYTSCSLCGRNYDKGTHLSNNIALAKKHLLFVHKKELQGDVEIALKISSLKKKEPVTKDNNNKDSKSKGRRLKKKQSELPSNCPYCRYKCNSSNIQISMGRHLVRFHPEHFLTESKEATELRHPQFQRILTDIVFPKFVLSIGEQHTKCSLCGLKYTGAKIYENTVFSRKHVMCQHKTEFMEVVKNVLEDEELEEKLSCSNANGVTCLCGTYFPNSERSVQSYHEKFHCIKKQKVLENEEKVHFHQTRRSSRRVDSAEEVNSIEDSDNESFGENEG